MARFQKQLRVSEDDIDDLDHVNNVRYVQWIQDISKEHWQAKATQAVQEEVIWVVLTHYIEYKSAAVINDPIILKTHIADSSGAKCTRIVEMFHGKTNTLLVRSSTEWCLLNRATLRPTRISEEIKAIFL